MAKGWIVWIVGGGFFDKLSNVNLGSRWIVVDSFSIYKLGFYISLYVLVRNAQNYPKLSTTLSMPEVGA